MDVLGAVLTIEEVKQRMKDVRIAAVHRGSVIHCGERGRDEMVILSTRLWEELNARKQAEMSAAELPREPYDAFARALGSGRLLPAAARGRRRMQVQTDSSVPAEQMVALGTEDKVSPRRRRARDA
jgi:hypothetical protein